MKPKQNVNSQIQIMDLIKRVIGHKMMKICKYSIVKNYNDFKFVKLSFKMCIFIVLLNGCKIKNIP